MLVYQRVLSASRGANLNLQLQAVSTGCQADEDADAAADVDPKNGALHPVLFADDEGVL